MRGQPILEISAFSLRVNRAVVVWWLFQRVYGWRETTRGWRCYVYLVEVLCISGGGVMYIWWRCYVYLVTAGGAKESH